ncbi:IRK-interacting protein-like [Quercus lobata]|uniref:IRK-interacting protein n=1 Tax=Quercus lobata TaxID=97700 RepID=A0A7N2R4P2_QUELO|nr:IRK-interacting protein-like [Quercus lobata]
MAPSSSSSSSSKSPPPPPSASHLSPHFTPIQECENEDGYSEEQRQSTRETTPSAPKRHPTPLHQTHKNGKPKKIIKQSDSDANGIEDGTTVWCNKCRPHAREKISVVPLDNNGLNKHSSYSSSIASPNGIFKSIFLSLTKKSPRSSPSEAAREEQWKIAVAELSQKLIHATRKRDEALLEASRLKYSMAELEKKLNKLEVYCHNLKSGLDECSTNSAYQTGMIKTSHSNRHSSLGLNDKVIEHFLVSVSESRSSVKLLSRSLAMQLRHTGSKVYERISVLLQPYDIKISLSKNPRSLVFYLEALLNKAFYEDFESIGFQRNTSIQILNPIDRCEANFESFNFLRGLTWEEVLNKGTRHFSEEYSRFCDRKMSEIVSMLGWNRAWPEPLLQAFFAASKSVWLVHLLANSVHPSLPIFKVDIGVGFDGVYMEDMGGDKVKRLVPSVVRIMVAPGFYVYGSVVKCKVLCRYYNATNNDQSNGEGKGIII